MVWIQGAETAAGLRERELQRAGLQAASGVGRPRCCGASRARGVARHRECQPLLRELEEDLVLRHGQILCAAGDASRGDLAIPREDHERTVCGVRMVEPRIISLLGPPQLPQLPTTMILYPDLV